MRIDKLLWYLRLARTRSVAQAMAEEGHMRLNGRRVERAHARVAVGDRLILVQGGRVRAIELVALPARRGPAPEAQSCFRDLDAPSDLPLAASNSNLAAKGDLQP